MATETSRRVVRRIRGIGIAIDLGGTNIKSAIVDNRSNSIVGPIRRRPTQDNGKRDAILRAFRDAVVETCLDAEHRGATPEFVAVAAPGPFSYERGASLMDHKFVAIREESLVPHIMSAAGGISSEHVEFHHDLHAFLWGEHLTGEAKGSSDVLAVSIGTGLGCGYIRSGMLQVSSALGPCLQLYRRPIRDGVLEDIVSHRGIIDAYRVSTGQPVANGVKEIAERARSGDAAAQEVFRDVGQVLGDTLVQVIAERQMDHVVLGGQISRAIDLFGDTLRSTVKNANPRVSLSVSKDPDASALIGAAALISQDPSMTMEIAC